MNPDLTAALAPILRDLARANGVVPDVRDQPWDDTHTTTAMLYAADGWGRGIRMTLGQPVPSQVAELADQVQEWAVEVLWLLGRSTSWPPCPHHPDTHPLTAVERSDLAVWMCPVLDVEIGEIGALTG